MSLYPTPSTLTTIPPSDFKNLLTTALDLLTSSTRFLEKLHAHPPTTSLSTTTAAAAVAATAKALLKRHKNLDTHYGWVLASDNASMGKALRGICTVEQQQSSDWFRDLVAELENLRRSLIQVVARG
jgi:hypothetical protein